MGRLKTFLLVFLLGGLGFHASAQVFDQKIADFILKVENPNYFLQRLEKIGVKDVMNSGSIGLDSAYHWLKKMGEQAGYESTTQSFIYNGFTLRNIEFVKKGTIDSCIIIGAHYDSKIGAGINDNGTGDFALFQMVKLLKGITTKYTLRFVYFSGEEINYLGSKHYVSTLNKDSVKIKFMLNLDQLGGTIGEDNTGIKCEQDEVSSKKAESNELAVSMAKIYSLYTNLYPVITSAYSSDYLSFRDSGYLISGIYQYSSFPYYHSENDLLKYVEFNSLISTVKGALAFVMHYSQSEIPAGINQKVTDFNSLNVYKTNKELIVTANAEYNLIIYDQMGRLRYSKWGNENDKNIALDDFKNGVYFVYLQSNGKMVTNKFLVQH